MPSHPRQEEAPPASDALSPGTDCERRHPNGVFDLRQYVLPSGAKWTCENEIDAYRRAALALHPDKNNGQGGPRFSEVGNAHKCLRERLCSTAPAKRRSQTSSPPRFAASPPEKIRFCALGVSQKDGAPYAERCHFVRKGETASPFCEKNAKGRCVLGPRTACRYNENKRTCRAASLNSQHDPEHCQRRSEYKRRCRVAKTACRYVAEGKPRRCRVAKKDEAHDEAHCQRRVGGVGRCRLQRAK